MICITVNEQKETELLAARLGQLVQAGDIICLTGDLGAGKTTFTQAFAKGMGVEEYVTSPTFTLIQEYKGRIPLFHFDVYRINHPSEVEDLGYEEYFYGNGVCVIEWANLICEMLPENYLQVEIKSQGGHNREICFFSTNSYYEKIIEELLI
jgi:tRNA threonylcarbamoyladenosine biosynthesis protein TsaE